MSRRETSFEELSESNQFNILKYQSRDQQKWDDFVRTSNNGTIFHTRRFLGYHPKERFVDHSFIFRKGERWSSVLPAAMVSMQGKRFLISHPGASFGGPVFDFSISLKDTFFVVQSLLEAARSENVDEVRFTLPPLIYHSRPGNYFDFALLESGFSYSKREVSSVIPLDFSEDETLSIFSESARRAARRAMKLGVKVRESDDFSAFYAILQNNLKMRHNVKPTHTLTELLQLKQLFPNDIRLFGATIEGELVAGVVTFTCNPKVTLAFYISHREDMQEYRGVNVLFHEVIRWAIRQGFKFLDFGIFTVNMKTNWGLARFKESFGALGVFRDTLVKKI